MADRTAKVQTLCCAARWQLRTGTSRVTLACLRRPRSSFLGIFRRTWRRTFASTYSRNCPRILQLQLFYPFEQICIIVQNVARKKVDPSHRTRRMAMLLFVSGRRNCLNCLFKFFSCLL